MIFQYVVHIYVSNLPLKFHSHWMYGLRENWKPIFVGWNFVPWFSCNNLVISEKQRHGWILYLIKFSSICGLLNSDKNWERYECSKILVVFWKLQKIMVNGGWRWLSKITPTLGYERVWSTLWPFDLTVGQFWFMGYY